MFGKFIKVLSNSPVIISFIVILVLTGIMIALNIKVVNKKVRMISAIVYSILVGVLFFSYSSTAFNYGDSILDSIHKNIYFPSIGTYLVILVASLVIVLITIFNKKVKTINKIINISAFVILLLLFVLVLDGLMTNEISISNQSKIYGISSLVTVIQTSMIIFLIWIVSVGSNSLINYVSKKYGKQKEEYIEFI